MQVTPSEVHHRIYSEVIENIQSYSRFPYIPYTEHLSALVSPSFPALTVLICLQVFEDLLQPVSLIHHPDTFGPRDHDPMVTFAELLRDSALAEEAAKGWLEELKIPPASIKYAAKLHVSYKKMRLGTGAERVLSKPVRE